MKFLLVVFCVFPSLVLATPLELRITSLIREGAGPEWDTQTSEFPQIFKNLTVQGSLRMARTKPFESIHPYDQEDGRSIERPMLIDDLFYEPLFLADPIGLSETRYPLIARAIRLAEDYSYAVFEIDPRARFQDGTPVLGSDVLASIEVLKNSSAHAKARIENAVSRFSANNSEVRVEFKAEKAAAMNALMFLAGTKIIKQNTVGATSVGGIRVRFTATGPYRLAQLGRSRLSLIIDPSYWGKNLGVRRGFFNLRAIDVVVYPDEAAARMSVADESANFLMESQPAAISATHQMLKTKNEDIVLVQEPATASGARIPALSFNLSSPNVADGRIRQAVLLAYDFEGINSSQFGGGLNRPLGLLDGSSLKPKQTPTEAVSRLMAICQADSSSAIETQGHGQYATIEDKRMRLLTAMRLLQEADLRLENGVFKRKTGQNSYEPLRLKILVRNHEVRAANFFRADLQRLGIIAQVVAFDGEAFRTQRARGDFELVSDEEGFLDKDGWPSADHLRLGEAQNLPCMKSLVQRLETEDPHSPAYLEAAEAIARLHESMTLGIFTGSPQVNTFFHDGRLNVPAKLSASRMHLYGYWLDHEPPLNYPNGWPGFNYMPGGCMDISCLFDHR